MQGHPDRYRWSRTRFGECPLLESSRAVRVIRFSRSRTCRSRTSFSAASRFTSASVCTHDLNFAYYNSSVRDLGWVCSSRRLRSTVAPASAVQSPYLTPSDVCWHLDHGM